jgi:hypothetical protein
MNHKLFTYLSGENDDSTVVFSTFKIDAQATSEVGMPVRVKRQEA